MRKIGFDWWKKLVQRTQLEFAGTLTAASLALEFGMVLNLVGELITPLGMFTSTL